MLSLAWKGFVEISVDARAVAGVVSNSSDMWASSFTLRSKCTEHHRGQLALTLKGSNVEYLYMLGHPLS